jgi:hypothetical protein
MAHYAEINYDNIVIRVIPGWDETVKSGMEQILLLETGNIWKRTSYNTHGGKHLLGGTPFRKNYAGIGFTYDAQRDAFIPPQPFPSWVLNEETCQWDAPVAMPTDGKIYNWDESSNAWLEVEIGQSESVS